MADHHEPEHPPIFWDSSRTTIVWIFAAILAVLLMALPVVLNVTSNQRLDSQIMTRSGSH